MKFVTVRDLRGRPAKVWKDLRAEQDMVLTSNGKPIALLTAVDEGSFEEELDLVRRARLARTIRTIQKEAREKFPRGVSKAFIEREIAAVRKARKTQDR